jgi:protein TonB
MHALLVIKDTSGEKLPRQQKLQKRTISAASHQTRDEAYLARWQSYVEDYGNRHYPEVALKNNLRGDLRLLVAVKKDGTVHEVSVRQSSGSPELDAQAIKLVHMASPFEPLPPEIAQDTEILEIIRTWQFRGKLSTSS